MSDILPPEVWLRVLLFLDVESVESVAQVSHDCRLLATDPHLWRLLALRTLGVGRRRDRGTEEVNLHPEDEGGGWRRTVLSWRPLRHRRLRFCFLGHVDCGKSTLIGRFLVNSGTVSKAAFELINRITWEDGSGYYACAWVTDRRKDERERGITLDYHIRTCQLSNGRTVEFIDTPGHRCYGTHAAEGLMLADVAVVSALHGEYENGLQDVAAHIRTARETNVRRLVVAVNKIDYSYRYNLPHPSFEEIKADMLKQAIAAGYREQEVTVLRLSGRAGHNVTTRTELPYHGYCGPALMELMEQITDEADPFSDYLASPPSASLVHSLVAKRPPYGLTRLSVLRRYNRRSRVAVACGLQAHEHLVAVVVQCGIVRAGQTLHVPFSTTTFTAAAPTFTVVGIQIHQRPVTKAVAGEIAALRLALSPAAAAGYDRSEPAARRRRHVVTRGVVLAGERVAPVASFTVHLNLAAQSPVLRCGHEPFCLIHSASLPCRVEKVVVRWDHHGDEVESLIEDGKKKRVAHEGCSVRVILKPMVGDVYAEPYSQNPALGTVLVVHSDHRVVAVGRVETVQYGPV